MTPEEYLAFLRRSMSPANPPLLRDDRLIREFHKQLTSAAPQSRRTEVAAIHRAGASGSETIAASEAPPADPIMGPRLDEVYAAGKLAGMANTDIRPLFGTLPTFQLNACTIEVPDDDRLIVAFAADLPEFLNRAAKIAIEVYCAIPDEVYEQVGQVGDPRDMYRGAVEDMLTRRDVVTRRFGAILAAFAYETPEFLPIQRPPASGALINVAKLVKVASWIRSALLLGAERFIAGHEFGYVATRVSGEPLESFQAKVRDVPFRAVRYSQRSEVEADVIGFMLNLYHAGRAYRPPAFPPSVTRLMEEFDTAGASFYFQAAEAFSNAHAKVNGRQSEMEDIHPSWEFRRQQLREVHRGYRGGDNLHAMMLEVILETLERRAAAMIEPMNALRLAWEEKLSGTEWQMKLD